MELRILPVPGIPEIGPGDDLGGLIAVALAAHGIQTGAVAAVRLLSNNPQKVEALAAAGLAVQRVPLHTEPLAANRGYLRTKQNRMGRAHRPVVSPPA